MKKIHSAVLLGAALIVSGCASRDLPDYYRLGKLRILAIQANPPEVDPSTADQSVSLKPVISGLNAAQTQLDYTLEVCLDPGVSLGQSPNCSQDPTRPAAQTGKFTLAAPAYTGPVVETLTVTVPTTVFLKRSSQDQFNGVPYLAVLTVTAVNGESNTAFRRLIATTRTPANVNPSITAVQASSTNLTSLPSVETALSPTLNANTGESYLAQIADGTTVQRQEDLTVTWFVSDGTLKYSRTDATSFNTWTPPGSTPVVPLFMYAIVRDDRGGVGYLPASIGP